MENSIHSSSGLRSSALCCQRRPLVAHMCSAAERVATFGHASASTVKARNKALGGSVSDGPEHGR